MSDGDASDEESNRSVDEETLRIMISTDNHLGYAEKDPIRGNDSFAAFEEVLVLAKYHNCDCVLLAGDLFHENKPSRMTLHKTMNILRRYTMGPKPVSFQIVSDQKANFRSSVNECVNYEDPYASIDLPIFSIHGNHDDPTRDGGSDMLAALDLLAVSNLVNYFGRQDEVDKVQVSPVLIQKGNTKVALYGMGSMRDERLNRMWQGKKVQFLRPVSSENDENHDDSYDDQGHWFNIFAIHQNRDLGRGTKNCIHESMIPEWMDLVVWGHEHECLINPSESAVGTFRITQPGSSVATSLSEGEAAKKHVGILDIRGSQFRLVAAPLSQVRPFAVGSVALSETRLDPMDDGIDEAMTEFLAGQVHKLIKEARNEALPILGDRSSSSNDMDEILRELHYRVQHPEQVLVRLKVEHSGFTTLNNSRFGSQFVNEVANPSDILLFHRRRAAAPPHLLKKATARRGKSTTANISDDEPIIPIDIDEVHIEDIVKDTLAKSDKKLSILEQEKIADAVEDFVTKEIKGILGETVDKIIAKQQRRLVSRCNEEDTENAGSKSMTTNDIQEVCESKINKPDLEYSTDINEQDLKITRKSSIRMRSQSISDGSVVPSPRKKSSRTVTSSKVKNVHMQSRSSREDEGTILKEEFHPRRTSKRSRTRLSDDDDSDAIIVDDDSDVEVIKTASPSRKRLTRTSKMNSKSFYRGNSDDDEDIGTGWGTAGSAR